MDIDKHIEAPDDDDEPRDICPECGSDVGDCDWMCSYSDDYYEDPRSYEREDDPDA